MDETASPARGAHPSSSIARCPAQRLNSRADPGPGGLRKSAPRAVVRPCNCIDSCVLCSCDCSRAMISKMMTSTGQVQPRWHCCRSSRGKPEVFPGSGDLPLREVFVAADVSLFAGLAAFPRFGMAPTWSSTTWTSHVVSVEEITGSRWSGQVRSNPFSMHRVV